MADEELSDALRQLITRHLPSMDHVAVLVTLHAMPTRAHTAQEIADAARIAKPLAIAVLEDLADAGLSERVGDGHMLTASSRHVAVVEQLVTMYNSRPVTLVRAVYDRPASAARSFADAFRLRKTDG